MNNINILKPNKENLNTFILLGSFFIILSFLDILGNTFLEINITGFLPSGISYFSPLMIGFFGLHLIRIE
jgi:general L-amino acid transport system permease protein